ncbi:MAG: phenylalanine--tRNA ligase subunit beta [bacterium]
MLVPVSWIKEYVDFDKTPEELARELTMAGLETNNLGSGIPDVEGVITARIEKIDRHPNADKLTLCRVRPAPDEDPLSVVCGAPNIKEGDMVPLALIGTVLPDGTKLKKTKIRGLESQGMMCSERELGISEDHTGIWILPPETPLGKALPEGLGDADCILETEPTPNRGDLLSVIGVAREVAAITGGKVSLPEPELSENGPDIQEQAAVEIEDYDGCPRYVARLIRGITIGPSPDWMVKRLETAGVRSINNVVDVTNYVMLETGQPLHAFDFQKLRKAKIVVRTAQAGDRFTTLDGQERELRDDTLMICDGEGQVAIAGVMGGLDSEVSEQTTDVLIESACFKPTSVRRTARLLGIPTEASKRFDKGVDPLGTVYAADRAASLMHKLAGGELAAGSIDARQELFEKKRIPLRPDRANLIMGASLSAQEQKNILARLDGADVEEEQRNIVFTAPSYRPDLCLEEDLVEEIARLYGYDSIPVDMPDFRMAPMPANPAVEFARTLRERMVPLGFNETVLTSFEDPKRLELYKLPEDDPRARTVKLENPLSENESILRTMLAPKLIATLVMNRSRGVVKAVRMYEINAVFNKAEDHSEEQRTMIAGVLSRPLEKELWNVACPEDGFFDIKMVVEHLLAATRFPGARIEPDSDPEPFLHPGKAARVYMGKADAGRLGQLHPAIAENLDLKNEAFMFELDFGVLSQYAGHIPKAGPVSRFPPTLRDMALVVDESVNMQDVIRVARKTKSPFLESMELFDIFRGGQVAAGKKSMAFHVIYQSLERTLTDEDVKKEHEKIAAKLHKELGAVLR